MIKRSLFASKAMIWSINSIKFMTTATTSTAFTPKNTNESDLAMMRSEELKNCLNFIDTSTLAQLETKQKCRGFVERFQKFIAVEMRDPFQYKDFYLRTLFSILHAFCEEEISNQRLNYDNAMIERLESVLNCFPDFSQLKNNCLIGAVLLANNQSIKFYEYLKLQNVSIGHDYVSMLCQIARVAKNEKIIEPIVEMPDFLDDNQFWKLLPKFYNELALIYGKKSQLDKLELLWRSILEGGHRNRIRRNDRIHFRHALHRIAHFYRSQNQRVPEQLAKELVRLENHYISYYPTKRPTEEQNEKGKKKEFRK